MKKKIILFLLLNLMLITYIDTLNESTSTTLIKKLNFSINRKLNEEDISITEQSEEQSEYTEEIYPSQNPTDSEKNANTTSLETNGSTKSKNTISIVLLQIRIYYYSIELYFLVDSFPEYLYLLLTAKITKLTSFNSRRNLEVAEPFEAILEAKIYDKINNIYKFNVYSEDEKLQELLDRGDNIKIEINKIELASNVEDIQINDLYILDSHLGEYSNNQNQPVFDFSTIFEWGYDGNYITKKYYIKEISYCTSEYKFNITINKELDLENTIKIYLVFKGKNKGKNIIVNAECVLLNLKNMIMCQADDETKNLNYTMDDYLFISENELISITANNDFTFPLYCYEKPPIVGIIAISSIFATVVIIVFIIIFFINKRGTRERGYEHPNNYNSNNVIGLSSGNYSK